MVPAGTSFWTGVFTRLETELSRRRTRGPYFQIFPRAFVNCPPCDGIEIAPSTRIRESARTSLHYEIGFNQILYRVAQGILRRPTSLLHEAPRHGKVTVVVSVVLVNHIQQELVSTGR